MSKKIPPTEAQRQGLKSRWPEQTIAERFWSKTIVDGDCIIWAAALNREGYGMFGVKRDGKNVMLQAHRWMYETSFGRFFNRHRVLRHICDNRRCVKPQHLEPGTHAQNVQDAIKRGRQAVGTAMPHAKLDEDKVRQILPLEIIVTRGRDTPK
jgi:hypothetical protein